MQQLHIPRALVLVDSVGQGSWTTAMGTGDLVTHAPLDLHGHYGSEKKDTGYGLEALTTRRCTPFGMASQVRCLNLSDGRIQSWPNHGHIYASVY
jgi:hypothetical protein